LATSFLLVFSSLLEEWRKIMQVICESINAQSPGFYKIVSHSPVVVPDFRSKVNNKKKEKQHRYM